MKLPITKATKGCTLQINDTTLTYDESYWKAPNGAMFSTVHIQALGVTECDDLPAKPGEWRVEEGAGVYTIYAPGNKRTNYAVSVWPEGIPADIDPRKAAEDFKTYLENGGEWE